MSSIDQNPQQGNNNNDFPVMTDEGAFIKIPKRDLVFRSTGGHKHLYMPDFTDETDDYCACSCVKRGCVHGVLFRKDNKSFISWLDKHRDKAFALDK